ncbi:MAG TPA: zincin-like metallopeptidase domain-containing protein [Bacteroidia bacterium]|jgi:antirestriction protein ArdC/lysophospholipase L1-like esterase
MKNSTKLIVAGAAVGTFLAIAGSGKSKRAKESPDLKRFLFIGDSLTVGFGEGDKSYADHLKELHPGVTVKKIAITGKQTGWMLQKLQEELATGNKYDVISIWGGVNDIYAKKSIDETKKNLQRMYDLSKESGAKVVALTTIPTRTYKISSSVTSGLTKMLDQWLKANPAIDELIDVNAIVNDGNDGTKSDYLQKDRLHLTRSAQKAIAKNYATKLSVNGGLGYVKKGAADSYNAARSKALALEIELDLLQLDQPGIELKYNRHIKASVAEAIKQLIEHGSLKRYSPMAIQVLYSSFKNVPGEIYDENDEEEKMIDVTDEKSLQFAMLKQLSDKTDLVHSWYSDDRFTLTPEGQRVIDSINARLETLKAKKRGSDLFPGLHGIDLLTDQEAIALIGANSLGAPGQSVYEIITDMIIKKVEAEKDLPWRKPWNTSKYSMMPQNYVSKKAYRGINAFLLLMFSPYSNPYYLTFKQTKELGGSVIKGSTPAIVTYFQKGIYHNQGKKFTTKVGKEKIKKADPSATFSEIPFLKYYQVFNAEQITGIDFKLPKAKEKSNAEQIDSCEQVVANMPKRPLIKWGGEEAFYSPSRDLVQMPEMKHFEKEQWYYSTLFHELVHSTKHATRLGTNKVRKIGNSFGDKNYAMEELVAEMGAAFLCANTGILYHTIENSAAYLKNWRGSLLKHFKEDKKFIFTASSEAQKAADYMLNASEVKIDPNIRAKALALELELDLLYSNVAGLNGYRQKPILNISNSYKKETPEGISFLSKKSYSNLVGRSVNNVHKQIEIHFNSSGRSETIYGQKKKPNAMVLIAIDHLAELLTTAKYNNYKAATKPSHKKKRIQGFLNFTAKMYIDGELKTFRIPVAHLTVGKKTHYHITELELKKASVTG